MTVHPLAVWFAERRATWQARAWLAASREPDLIAAEALRRLNRHASATKPFDDQAAWRIYAIKRDVLRALFDAWPCKVTTQEQNLMCNGCSGRGYRVFGPPWDRYHEPCFHCRGTGVYKIVQLYAFDFTIAGRPYSWHQPADLCSWAGAHVVGQGAPYVAPTWHALDDRLANQHVRVLLAVLGLWLAHRLQRMLLPGGPRWHDLTLRQALHDEFLPWRNVLHILFRRLRRTWWDEAAGDDSPTEGTVLDQDDLPF